MRPLLVVSVLTVLAASIPASAAPLPQLPGPGGTNASAPASSPAPAADAEQLRRGIVQVEQGGRPLAVGTVLSKDGRVITSLSGIANVDAPDIRYADGTVVKAKVGHRDKTWDLALLIPQSGRWLDGLMPTDIDPQGLELRSFLPKNGKLTPTGVSYKGRTDVRSKEGEPLKSALEVDLKGTQAVPGAPILEPNGRVVGVLVKSCKEGDAAPAKDAAKPDDKKTAACSPVVVGAPVYALRGFLMKTPTTAIAPAPWLGLGGGPQDPGSSVKGVKVMGVAPGSPAEKAGLKAGENPDTIVAVEGVPVEKPEQLAEAIGKHAIGQTVKLLVYSGGKFRDVPVTLRPTP